MHCAPILVADDHPLVAESIRQLLGSRFSVVGTVGTGEETIVAEAKSLRPGVVLLDVNMPGMSGFEAWWNREIRPSNTSSNFNKESSHETTQPNQ